MGNEEAPHYPSAAGGWGSSGEFEWPEWGDGRADIDPANARKAYKRGEISYADLDWQQIALVCCTCSQAPGEHDPDGYALFAVIESRFSPMRHPPLSGKAIS